MFTGIITHQGKVKKIEFNDKKDCLLAIEIVEKIARNLEIGCSIANNGICLTLIKKEDNLLYFQASSETCEVTTLKNWQINDEINIEFALRLGDEFGGHIVSGHVDGIAKLTEKEKINESWYMKFQLLDANLMKFIAKKGSICIDGISLTVNEIGENFFEVNIIPHTLENTNLKALELGFEVNIEVDLLARYVLKG